MVAFESNVKLILILNECLFLIEENLCDLQNIEELNPANQFHLIESAKINDIIHLVKYLNKFIIFYFL